jgi:hypothetical protein
VTVTIPLVLLVAALVLVCYRYMGLRLWHLLVCLLLGFLVAATSYGPQIQNFLNAVFYGRHQ